MIAWPCEGREGKEGDARGGKAAGNCPSGRRGGVLEDLPQGEPREIVLHGVGRPEIVL